MVKEVKLQGCIEYMKPQAVFSFLFGDDKFAKRYHKEQNDDPYAEVSDWTVDGRRTVRFSATLSAPKVLKTVIGVDTLNVTELQKYSAIGDTFIVISRPTVKPPQGWCVEVEMVLSPAEKQNGCLISTTVILEYEAAIWGVQDTIENFMERKVKRFFWEWLRFARLFLMEQFATANRLPYTGKEEVLPEAAALDDEFFDLSKQDEKALNLTGEIRKLGVIYSKEGKTGLQNWIIQSVMGQLSGIHITCYESRSHVEELNRRLQKMEDDILMVQKRLQGGFSCKECIVWSFGCVVAGVLYGAGHMYLRSRRS